MRRYDHPCFLFFHIDYNHHQLRWRYGERGEGRAGVPIVEANKWPCRPAINLPVTLPIYPPQHWRRKAKSSAWFN